MMHLIFHLLSLLLKIPDPPSPFLLSPLLTLPSLKNSASLTVY